MPDALPFPERFPESIPLMVSVNAQDGAITDVGPYTHTVIWAGDTNPSCIRYCNGCGSPFFQEGRLKASVDPAQRIACACGACHRFMGFVP